MNCSTPGLPLQHQPWSPPKLMSIESVIPSNHLILCRPLLLLPSIFANIRVFCNESVLSIRWPKYWSFDASASVLPMNTQDWSPLGWTGWIYLQARDSQESSPIPQLKNISSLALSFLYCSVLTSIITGKTIALTIQTFVGKVTSLLFNMLSRVVITFLKE